CHDDPEKPGRRSGDPERYPLLGLAERLPAAHLATFLQAPAGRYPDGRMPKLPVDAGTARDIAAYLLMWSKPAAAPPPAPGKGREVQRALRRLGSADRHAGGAALVREKGCARCHAGLGESAPGSILIRQATGCLEGKGSAPRFTLDGPTRRGITAYWKVAG